MRTRTRTHKLIQNYNEVMELYDLEADPDEVHNIAEQQPALVRELMQQLAQRFQEGKWRR